MDEVQSKRLKGGEYVKKYNPRETYTTEVRILCIDDPISEMETRLNQIIVAELKQFQILFSATKKIYLASSFYKCQSGASEKKRPKMPALLFWARTCVIS